MKKHTFLLLVLMGCTLGVSGQTAQNNIGAEYQSGEAYLRNAAHSTPPADTSATDTTHRDSARDGNEGAAAVDTTANDSTQNVPAATAQGSDGQMASILMMGLCIVALILGLMAYIKSAKAMKEIAKRMKAQQAEADVTTGSLTRKLNQLAKEQQELEQRLSNLAMQKQPTTQTAPQHAYKPHDRQPAAAITKAPSAPSEKTHYAWSVTDGAFGPTNFTSTPNSHTMAILTCGSDGRGTFVINSDGQAQPELLSNAEVGFMLVADVQRKVPAPHRIVTLKPGEIVLQNGHWHVTRKALVAIE